MTDSSVGQEAFLTLRATAARLGVTERTVHRWMGEGLPSHQPGGGRGRRLFDPDEVDAWVRSRCPDSAPGRGAA